MFSVFFLYQFLKKTSIDNFKCEHVLLWVLSLQTSWQMLPCQMNPGTIVFCEHCHCITAANWLALLGMPMNIHSVKTNAFIILYYRWVVGCWHGCLLGASADLHVAQLIPLPLTVSCFSKIQIGFTFVVLAHPGSPGKRPLNVVCVSLFSWLWMGLSLAGDETWKMAPFPHLCSNKEVYISGIFCWY